MEKLKNILIPALIMLLSIGMAYSQQFKIGLSSSAAHYPSANAAYYFNLGLNAAYEHQLSAGNALSVGISHFNHSFKARFPETQNSQTRAYGTTGVLEIPISFVHYFKKNALYLGLGLSLNTSKTKSVPVRIKSIANENAASVSTSINYTEKDNRIYGLAPRITFGKNIKLFKADNFFIEMSTAYYSKLPELYIIQKVNTEINRFASPEKAFVYTLNLGYRLSASKK